MLHFFFFFFGILITRIPFDPLSSSLVRQVPIPTPVLSSSAPLHGDCGSRAGSSIFSAIALHSKYCRALWKASQSVKYPSALTYQKLRMVGVCASVDLPLPLLITFLGPQTEARLSFLQPHRVIDLQNAFLVLTITHGLPQRASVPSHVKSVDHLIYCSGLAWLRPISTWTMVGIGAKPLWLGTSLVSSIPKSCSAAIVPSIRLEGPNRVWFESVLSTGSSCFDARLSKVNNGVLSPRWYSVTNMEPGECMMHREMLLAQHRALLCVLQGSEYMTTEVNNDQARSARYHMCKSHLTTVEMQPFLPIRRQRFSMACRSAGHLF